MYSYNPLPKGSIRVVEIHSGQFDDDIVIALCPEPFNPSADASPILPSYEALSYTWGSMEDSSVVHVHGVPDGKIQITRNLDIALRHLRHADQSRIMWIDAICIDQSNDVEKGPQVAMMGDLYEFAERVVVWLGPEENNSNHAMELMVAIGAQIEVDFDSCEMTPSATAQDPTLADENAQLPLNEVDLCSLYYLFCRPWFERLWIRQEICLASMDAIIVCGFRSMPWHIFRQAWTCFYLKPKEHFEFSDELTARSNSLSGLLFQDVGRLLPYLRRDFEHAKCADPRDRIYALLSLDKTIESLGIVPDYTMAPAELYEDVTKRCMGYFPGLEILTECEMPYGIRNLEGPSWVPDWSVGNPYVLHLSAGVVYASGPLVGGQPPIVDHRLQVIAVPIDTIEELHQPPPILLKPNAANADVQLGVKQMLSGKDLSSNYIDGKPLLEAYVRTFTLDQFAETYSPATDSFPSYDESIQLLKTITSLSESSLPIEDDERYFARLQDVLHGRRILETTNKYIGLAPPSALPGDEICVILGCSLPMILRRVDDERRRIVGACYVCGLNDGEAILGPMPDGVRFVQKLNEEGYDEGFINDETGETSEEDPRLRDWPTADLVRAQEGSNLSAKRFVVDFQYLRDRGVNCRSLELI